MKHWSLYWKLQWGAWSAWTLNEVFLYTSQYGWRWEWLPSALLNLALALGLTHGYKLRCQARNWLDMPMRKLIPNQVLALLAMAMGMALPNQLLDYYLLQQDYDVNLQAFYLLQVLLNFIKPLAIWQLVYFLYKYTQRQYEMELKNQGLAQAIQETEAQILRVQMNPHFVFNALNSIRALITEDPQKAKKGINQLSKLLRSSLLSDRKQTIALQEELDTVLDFLALEKIRYEERLDWKLSIAPEALAAQIPPMLLQTLVENAIKHGISKSIKGGQIEILASMVPGFLELTVRNPGKWLERTRAEGAGLGLQNSQDRMRLLFGDTARLILKPLDKNMVEAQVRIPYLSV